MYLLANPDLISSLGDYPVLIGNKVQGVARETASVVGPLCTPLDLLADRIATLLGIRRTGSTYIKLAAFEFEDGDVLLAGDLLAVGASDGADHADREHAQPLRVQDARAGAAAEGDGADEQWAVHPAAQHS